MTSLCKVCGKLVSKKNIGLPVQSHENLLQMHRNKHFDTECNVCLKTFKNRKAMTEHRAHVHVKLIDKYCRFCKKKHLLIDQGL